MSTHMMFGKLRHCGAHINSLSRRVLDTFGHRKWCRRPPRQQGQNDPAPDFEICYNLTKYRISVSLTTTSAKRFHLVPQHIGRRNGIVTTAPGILHALSNVSMQLMPTILSRNPKPLTNDMLIGLGNDLSDVILRLYELQTPSAIKRTVRMSLSQKWRQLSTTKRKSCNINGWKALCN